MQLQLTIVMSSPGRMLEKLTEQNGKVVSLK